MTERKSYSSGKFRLELPYLLEVQKSSFHNFLQLGVAPRERLNSGMERVFRDTFPITDMKELFVLRYEGYSFGVPKYSIKECRERGLTYAVPLRARLRLEIFEEDGERKKLKESIENEVFVCDLPRMTDNGTFIINGAERVIVSQLHRSPGVSFDQEFMPTGKSMYKSRIIPYRGSWVEFNTENDILFLIIDRKRKIPATILLRALGIARNEDILSLFYQKEEVIVDGSTLNSYLGRVLFSDVVDTSTGEVIAEANKVLDQQLADHILESGIASLTLIAGNVEEDILIHNTLNMDAYKADLHADASKLEDRALCKIFEVTHPNQEEAPNVNTARVHFENLFFKDPRKYDLGDVGRYRLNAKIFAFPGMEGMRPPLDTMTMTREDFLAIVRYMVGLYNEQPGYYLDDIDHLGNRRSRSVGELLGNQLGMGLNRMTRAIRERLNLRDQEGLTPTDLVNARTVSSVVATFFGSSQLSQFMDQTNPLAELTHKRRMSALGPGGLTRERAGFEVRDVHHTHYGRLCPIETPEGPNIGLINSLATFAIINNFGFLETPYRIVGDLDFKDSAGNIVIFPEERWHFGVFKGFTKEPSLFIKDSLSEKEAAAVRATLDATQRDIFDRFCNKVFEFKTEKGSLFVRNGKTLQGFSGSPDYTQVGQDIRVRVSDFITYLTADEEDKYRVAPASAPLDADNYFVEAYVIVRYEDEYPAVQSMRNVTLAQTAAGVERLDLMDVSPMQIVSVAAGLIPFLEHDDANRALMGSNMQRQAVPLLRSEAPVIGTGLEARAALDSGTVIRAKYSGEVKFVDANKVVVLRDPDQGTEYEFLGLSDEDEYELRKFERSNQDTCINQKPIVGVGQRVQAGEVLADGASTEQGELALGKNIRVGFLPWNGYNYEDAIIISEELSIKDTFTSIHIEEFEVEVRDTKRGPEELTREIPNMSEESLTNLDENGIIRVGAEVEAGDIIVGKVTPKGETELSPEERLLRAIFGEKAGDVRDSSLKAPPGMKGVVVETRVFSRKERDRKNKNEDKETIENIRMEFTRRSDRLKATRNLRIEEILVGQTCGDIRDGQTNEILIPTGKKLTKSMLDRVDFNEVSLDSQFSKDDDLNEKVVRILEVANSRIEELVRTLEKEIDKVVRGDELKPGVLQMVKVYIAKKRRLQIGDKMAGRHGNKGVISKVVPVEDMPFTEDGQPLQIILNPLGVPSRMNVGQVLEVHLGWAAKALGFKVATPVFDGATFEQIQDEMDRADLGSIGADGRRTGKTPLYDGRTGEAFKNDVTIGYMYMLKLGHLVDDKIHARSIGPYSLVTQQPLGGKSQLGGQRFGEMEVWALEAYGAAYTLQELLTVKSDDVMGRSKIYESIVKGENTPQPGVPESFRVLIREIRALGLDIKSGDE
jgi:DNA-directed RNA polymerase subunit beta